MKRRQFIKNTGAAALPAVVRGVASPAVPPNFVLILADDMGYGDASCYGSQIETPNLDAMAAEGVRFNNFYSASPVCSPSRASVLTGRYGVRCGVQQVLTPDAKAGLALNEVTIAQMLKPAGYTTGIFGKWQLGRQEDSPQHFGFDTSVLWQQTRRPSR